jgi:hypothetical protein
MEEQTRKHLIPQGALTRGLAAGVVGTACMTVLQEVMGRRRRARMPASIQGVEDADPWSHAPAPAQLGKRVMEDLTGREVPADRIPVYTNVMHWGYGISMGAAYGLAQRWLRRRPAVQGPLFGLGVWASSYATLVPLGLYQWPWHYRPAAIAKDLSYHLVYGSGVAAGYELVARRKR